MRSVNDLQTSLSSNLINSIIKYKWLVIALGTLASLYIMNPSDGIKAAGITLDNFISVAKILPPIFVLIGLMDTWITKDSMVKYMGEKSGMIGVVIAVFLGAVGAGPLYVAFPIAAVLIKKGARLAYVFIFLGSWVSVKLPIFMYEWASFGSVFTLAHVATSMVVYIAGGFLLEAVLSKETKDDIRVRAETA